MTLKDTDGKPNQKFQQEGFEFILHIAALSVSNLVSCSLSFPLEQMSEHMVSTYVDVYLYESWVP